MTELKDKKVTVRVKLDNGKDADGKAKFRNISLKDINPALADEDLYNIAEKVVGLQKLEMVDVYKLQNDRVVNA
ncbi:DUF1659 domain-containing protein [Acetoanaerobium noterae]|uniref:DUF1659 domain-containing protein n=1 Tax=Acetoanaerobium noterae TaxID=745369 RepID=UPI0032214132